MIDDAAAEAELRRSAGLSHRLDALEREHRRLRRFNNFLLLGVAVLLGLAVAFAVISSRYGMPGTVGDLVSARQYVLRGRDGAVRGLWGTEKDGAVRLVLQDGKARPRVKLNLLADGSSGLSYADSVGHLLAVFALLPDHSGSLVFADGSGTTRLVLGVSPDGAANVVFADRTGATRAGLGVDGKGGGSLTLVDRQGRDLAGTEATEPVDSDTTSTPHAAPESSNAPRRR
jgi:hypothetical protein